jgi:uncharacterized Zn finger protein (UPF0148 family)
VLLHVTCPACRTSWRSHAGSGRTRCPQCDTRVYVPADIRRAAEERPGGLLYDPSSGRLARVR